MPQAIFQSVAEREHVLSYFALRDHRVVGLRKGVLDRLFDGDDAKTPFANQQVDEHRQCGGFPRTGYAANQHKPIAKVRQPVSQIDGKARPLEIGNSIGNDSKAGRHAVPADEKIYAKTLGRLRSGQLDAKSRFFSAKNRSRVAGNSSGVSADRNCVSDRVGD